MIRIAISAAAFEAIAGTLPVGRVKTAGLLFGILGALAGIRAALLWWRASGVTPTVSGPLDHWRDIQDGEWIAALLTAVQASADLNGQAALWTAASVVLNVISTVLATWP